MPSERIQKLLAAAGCGPRRACEELVLDGRVTVNGEVVRILPVMVDPERDRITVDGKPLRPARLVYFILNKPSGVFCTQSDPEGRKRAVDLLVGVRERVFPVGRLDADSTGLLLLTNDGDLAQHLTHPRYGVPKTYHADVSGCPTQEAMDKLRTGVWLAEGKTAPAVIKVLHRQRDKAVLEITIREGRNREIRRMLAKLGHKVRRLTRVRMGKLTIRGLSLGAFRHLSREEITYLRSLADRDDSRAGAGSPRGAGRARLLPSRRPAARGRDRPRPSRPAQPKRRRMIT
jgi:23S rRNA pseudouridine2605 synthase